MDSSGRITNRDEPRFTTLNPVIRANAVTGDLSTFIFSYAVRYDEHGQPVPDAVTEVPTVADGDVSETASR